MTQPTPLSQILSTLSEDGVGRSECLVPIDDDWKERMRALAQEAQAGLKPQEPDDREQPSAPEASGS